MSHYGLRVYAISLTAIVAVWAALLVYFAREVSRLFQMSL
jgi:hypothetical protein